MEQFIFALQVLVIGFLVVLITLFMLYGILLLFSHLFYKKEKEALSYKSVSISDKNKGHDIFAAENERKVIAVIIAAVNEYLSQDDHSVEIAGISIFSEQAGNAAVNSWNIIGRKALMENRSALEKIRRKDRIEII